MRSYAEPGMQDRIQPVRALWGGILLRGTVSMLRSLPAGLQHALRMDAGEKGGRI